MRKPKAYKLSAPKSAHRQAVRAKIDRSKTPKAVTSVTAEQFMMRHQYCISIDEILRQADRDPAIAALIEADPDHHKAVCDHPEDGFCFYGLPDADTLKQINDKLGFKYKEADKEKVDNGIDRVVEAIPSEPQTERKFQFKLTIGA